MFKFVKSAISFVIMCALIAFFALGIFGVGTIKIGYGKSMSHTNDNEILIGIVLNKADIEYGDLVFAKYPSTGEDIIKRVIGMPGDSVDVIDGVIYVNGEANNDYSYGNPTKYNNSYGLISDGKYFICGDNRSNSADSRRIGPVSVLGKYINLFTITLSNGAK